MVSRRSFRLWPAVTAGVILNSLLLCAPVMFVNQGFLHLNPWKFAVFLFVISLWCIVESIASASGLRLPLKSHGPQCLPLLAGLSLLITFWVSLADAALSISTRFGAQATVGALLMVLGLGLRYASIRTLQRFFVNEVAILAGQPLVTHGIYGLLRHPSETGTLGLALGGSMLLGSEWGFLTGALLLLPALTWRTRLEDAMLRNHYQMEFHGYARAVPAFLPRILRRGGAQNEVQQAHPSSHSPPAGWPHPRD